MREHMVIPDGQQRPGFDTNHFRAAGNYAVSKQPDVIVFLGDLWDMHSLSSYDAGKKAGEGARYQEDVNAGIEALEAFLEPLWAHNRTRERNKKKKYQPRLVFCLGNHEERILRYVNDNPQLEGKCGYDDLRLEEMGFEVYDYQVPVDIDGVLYCHNFVNTDSLKKSVIGGTIENKMKHVGQSFTMGHQQILQSGIRFLNSGRVIRGCVAGAFYQHWEEYMGPQGNHHFRGCLYKHEVKNGNYNLMELSMDYLLRRWS
jgi:hypothetical protein